MARTTERVGIWAAIGATGAATALGASAVAATSARGWDFPSWQETSIEIAWMLGLVVIMFVGFLLTSGHPPAVADVGLVESDVAPSDRRRRRRAAALGIVLCALALGPLAALAGSGNSSNPTHLNSAMTPALLVVTFVVRWPISVIAQQVFFFGWLQPRLGPDRRGIPIAVALFVASHAGTPTLLLIMIPIGIAFALERWQTGSVRAGIVTHYAINIALFALSATT
jgi:Type II CAAX prenyl endopeptidase Rce1-like